MIPEKVHFIFKNILFRTESILFEDEIEIDFNNVMFSTLYLHSKKKLHFNMRN